jgi:hypothetical protein
MTKNEIFKTLITILRPENVRRMMEFNINDAQEYIYPRVQAQGLTVLGMGMYAIVVEHSLYPGRAFKVTTSRWDGFRQYAQYCIENADKEYIPVIHSAQEKGNFAWYEMDKYYPIVMPCNGYEAFVSIKGEDMYSYAHAGQYSDSGEFPQGTDEQIAIYQLAREIANTFGKRFTLDIHTGNIMVDGNGDVFITDPLGGDLRREIPITEEDPIFD